MAVEITDYELSPKSRKVCGLFMLIFLVVVVLRALGVTVPDAIKDIANMLVIPSALLLNATRLSIWVRK
ncbi:hypothetical protein [Vibrio sp. 1180_3]|uniref:hypothetical protein n=1 Tax=Vibrio sp. 1180_3 TaxID=2528832 RepID=UPI002406FE6F|nr:hypothetical protein [Vibrio sp. 1180_3]MDF9399208.1 hypothetical protein [Vibrio sp. 1180_3]